MRADYAPRWQSLPSLIDRLIDDAPQDEWDAFRSQTTDEILSVLQRDLNNLIMTRRSLAIDNSVSSAVADTLPGYGMPDLTSFSLSSAEHRARLRRELERTLRTFEMRLSDLIVTEGEVDATGGRIGFWVEARLNVEPRPLEVTFSAEMSLAEEYLRVHLK